MKGVEAIILAGGKGVRMGNLTQERQKCLLPIDGEPALGQVIDNLVSAFGSLDLKVSIDYKSEQVIEYVDKKKSKKISVSYIPHSGDIEGWEIYRGILPHVRGSFIATPGDIIALPEAYTNIATIFENEDVDGAMTLSPHLEAVDTHGVGKLENSRVTDLQWPPPHQSEPEHLRDMTIWASDKQFFDLIEKYPSPKKSIGVVFMKAIHDNRPIAGNLYTKQWIHLGYPEDLEKSMQNR